MVGLVRTSASVSQKLGDFLVLLLRHSLILIEIKDWSACYIQSVNRFFFTIKHGEKSQH